MPKRARLLLLLFLLTALCGTAAAGEFAKAKNYAVGLTPASVQTGDLNGDGALDLVVGNLCGDTFCHTPGSVSVLLANGDGTFQPAVDYAASSFVESVAVADFNGDGKLDIAVANLYGGAITMLLGNGDGSFQPGADSDAGLGPGFLAVGDFNNDGKPDLAVIGGSGCFPPSSSPVSVVLGNGDGTFGEPLTSCAGAASATLAVGDLDGDGRADLVVANWNEGFGTNISVLLGNGDGTFQPAVEYAAESPYSVALADLNHDGKLDVVVGSAAPGPESIRVLLGNGDGTLQAAVSYGSGLFSAEALALADFNNDGNMDVAGGSFGASVSVLLGKGDGTFYPAASTYSTAWEPSSIAVGDFNGDGQIDIAAANSGTNNVSALLNAGNAPVGTLSATGLRFGGVQVGQLSSPKKVTFTNTGYSTLIISSITVSGDFLTKNDCGGQVAIQASCTITVQFGPRAPGLRTGTVTILDNGKPQGQVIHLRGFGTA
jgi:hypothetical protein